MDLQTDINWLKAKLDQVRDPELINKLKSVFQSDQSNEGSVSKENLDEAVRKQMIATADRSEEDIKAGRVFSIEEAEQRLQQRLGY